MIYSICIFLSVIYNRGQIILLSDIKVSAECGNRMMVLQSLYDMGKLPVRISAINLAPNVKASRKRFS